VSSSVHVSFCNFEACVNYDVSVVIFLLHGNCVYSMEM
jgi:hypothetical protein